MREALAHGARGVVVGALTTEGDVDVDVVRRWADAAREVRPDAVVTVHRAVDLARFVEQAVAAVVGIADRVPTSGGAPTVRAGLPALLALVRDVGDRVEVMAGGGARLEDVGALVDAGVAGLHLSAKRRVGGGAAVALGKEDDGGRLVTDGAAAVRRALDEAVDAAIG